MSRVGTIARTLDDAWRERSPIDAAAAGALSLDDAYLVQHELIGLRTERGDRVTGAKLGFTSRAKMVQMGVDTSIVGTLTSGVEIADGASVDITDFIHPRIEPEIAFLLDRDVDLDASALSQIGCIGAVAPALEVIDSRFHGFSFTLSSVVADNTSAAGYAIGPWSRFDGDRPIDNLAVRMIVGDTSAAVGSTAAILGHPLRVLPVLFEIARRHGYALPAGTLILAGAATAAVPLTRGIAAAQVAGLGRVQIAVMGEIDG